MEDLITLPLKVLTHFQNPLNEMVTLNDQLYLALHPHVIGILAGCIEIIKFFPHTTYEIKTSTLEKLKSLYLSTLQFETHKVHTTSKTSLTDLHIKWIRIVEKTEKAIYMYVKSLV